MTVADDFAEFMAEAALLLIRPFIPSRTLREDIRVTSLSPGKWSVYLDHYWALYVDEGRRSISAPTDKKGRRRPMIWFVNRNLDPRIRPPEGHPRRVSLRRRLSAAEFRAFKRAGALIIALEVGPIPAVHFMRKGTAHLPVVVGLEAKKRISAMTTGQLARDGLLQIRGKLSV